VTLYPALIPSRVYRIGRAPDPWSWRDWSSAGSDGTFGNRWDDSEGTYRVLYAATDRVGAFLEVLARFRPDLHVIKELQSITGNEAHMPPGVPIAWLENRLMGEATLVGEFVDIGHSESLADLRGHLAARVVHYGIDDLDASAIRRSERSFTQELSRYVYKQRFDGISYLSRLGDEYRLWAIFEPGDPTKEPLEDVENRRITADDPDFRKALDIFGLPLVSS
jgi:hypothetical protein